MTNTPSSSSPSSNYGSDIEFDLEIDLTLSHDSSTVAATSDYGSDIDLTDIDLLNLLDEPTPLYPPLPNHDYRPRHVAIQYEDEAIHPPLQAQAAAVATLPTISPEQPEADPTDTLPAPPGRSPYDRFRSRRGRLSVTDLVTGVWCEQQFMYSLETGFKRRTPAMRKGTKLHKILEEEVHTTVPVRTKSREDEFGLKLFNMCQGFQSLSEYGMTRELEVFGWFDGVYISGIIDEITYAGPRLGSSEAATETETGVEVTTEASSGDDESFTTCPDNIPRTVYISDTKTRMTPTVPKESQQLSASLQLTYYHSLLASLPSISFENVLKHHNLSPTNPLSDTFIAQLASLQTTIELPELLAKNSLPGMWSLVLSQYAKAIDSVGDTVGVTYRYQASGDVIAELSWKIEEDKRKKYLEDVMQWWKGRRGTRGVSIEDAWKCGMCEFKEGCTWRLSKIVETRKKGRDEFAKNEKADPRDKVEIDESAVEMTKKVKREGVTAINEEQAVNEELKPRHRRRKSKDKEGVDHPATAGTDRTAVQVVVKRGRGRPRKGVPLSG